jgi:cysteine synthase
MKKDKILAFFAFVLLMGAMGACSVLRAAYGIPEPRESEASIRRKMTFAVDKASTEIISSLPKGVKLAVIGGSSSGNEQEIVISYLKSQGFSSGQALVYVQQMNKEQVSAMATQIKGQGVSSPENSYADYAVEDLEYNMVKAGFRLVDRQQIEKIRNEQQFQMSGEVDDNSAVSIGKMAGANAVIIISVNYVDKSGRLTLKVLDVQTAEIITMARQEF